MAKKKPNKPAKLVVNGIPHTLVVFEVTGTFPNGTPRHCTRIAELGTVRVDTPEPKEFITAYVPAVVLQQKG